MGDHAEAVKELLRLPGIVYLRDGESVINVYEGAVYWAMIIAEMHPTNPPADAQVFLKPFSCIAPFSSASFMTSLPLHLCLLFRFTYAFSSA